MTAALLARPPGARHAGSMVLSQISGVNASGPGIIGSAIPPANRIAAPDAIADHVKNLATEFPVENGKARIVDRSGDIADPAEAGELVALALSPFGRLNNVVCNADIDIIKPTTDYTADEWGAF